MHQHNHAQRVKTRERWILLTILLTAWMLRWIALADAPPGWRDDDLIEIYAFSQRILESGPKLYFAGASGHEPLYHTIRAPLLAVAGVNQASARWLAASAGMLSVLLTWAVGRQLLSRDAGLLSAAMLSLCFWSLMYSRVAIRHIAALPWMLIAIYWSWRELTDDGYHPSPLLGIAVGTAGAILTYYAGRLMPALLLATLPILWINVRRWPRFLSALGAGVLIAAPMFIAAAKIPGADARVSEVAAPLHALTEGDFKPLIETTLTTLSMFHATGDPEWLYNISKRPVFGPLGATLFTSALIFQLVTFKQRRSRFLLLWLVTGLSPAFISLPPSSYGHTVLAMPAVYLMVSGLIVVARRSSRILALIVVVVSLIAVGGRDVPDYFVKWSNHSMVEFLYRADYRALAQHLDDHHAIKSAVIGSLLYGPWDKVAVETDIDRDMPNLRWVNPARSLIFTPGTSTRLYLQHEGQRHPIIQSYLEQADSLSAPVGMEGFQIPPSATQPKRPYLTEDCDGTSLVDQPFENTLSLSAVEVDGDQSTNHLTLTLWWDVQRRPPLPSEQLIPNPPPPGVYNGPRLKVFVHSTQGAHEAVLDIDDGIGVDPYSLREGDTWLQVHELKTPEGRQENPRIRIGLYDPKDGSRWTLPDGRDAIWICVRPGQENP
jgi:hypothetical protein